VFPLRLLHIQGVELNLKDPSCSLQCWEGCKIICSVVPVQYHRRWKRYVGIPVCCQK